MQKSILILEQNPVIHELIDSALTQENTVLELQHETNSDQFVPRAKENVPDLILLSNKDQENNYTVVKTIKEDPVLNAVPLLLLTSAKDKLDVNYLSDLGVTGFIRKPFESTTLQKQISEIFDGLELHEINPSLARSNSSSQLEALNVVDDDLLDLISGDSPSEENKTETPDGAEKVLTINELEDELEPTKEIERMGQLQTEALNTEENERVEMSLSEEIGDPMLLGPPEVIGEEEVETFTTVEVADSLEGEEQDLPTTPIDSDDPPEEELDLPTLVDEDHEEIEVALEEEVSDDPETKEEEAAVPMDEILNGTEGLEPIEEEEDVAIPEITPVEEYEEVAVPMDEILNGTEELEPMEFEIGETPIPVDEDTMVESIEEPALEIDLEVPDIDETEDETLLPMDEVPIDPEESDVLEGGIEESIEVDQDRVPDELEEEDIRELSLEMDDESLLSAQEEEIELEGKGERKISEGIQAIVDQRQLIKAHHVLNAPLEISSADDLEEAAEEEIKGEYDLEEAAEEETKEKRENPEFINYSSYDVDVPPPKTPTFQVVEPEGIGEPEDDLLQESSEVEIPSEEDYMEEMTSEDDLLQESSEVEIPSEEDYMEEVTSDDGIIEDVHEDMHISNEVFELDDMNIDLEVEDPGLEASAAGDDEGDNYVYLDNESAGDEKDQGFRAFTGIEEDKEEKPFSPFEYHDSSGESVTEIVVETTEDMVSADVDTFPYEDKDVAEVGSLVLEEEGSSGDGLEETANVVLSEEDLSDDFDEELEEDLVIEIEDDDDLQTMEVFENEEYDTEEIEVEQNDFDNEDVALEEPPPGKIDIDESLGNEESAEEIKEATLEEITSDEESLEEIPKDIGEVPTADQMETPEILHLTLETEIINTPLEEPLSSSDMDEPISKDVDFIPEDEEVADPTSDGIELPENAEELSEPSLDEVESYSEEGFSEPALEETEISKPSLDEPVALAVEEEIHGQEAKTAEATMNSTFSEGAKSKLGHVLEEIVTETVENTVHKILPEIMEKIVKEHLGSKA